MKKTTILLLSIIVGITTVMSQVAINTDGSTPHSSAGLDVKFTNKGFLPPQMTVAQRDAISSPAVSLVVYCTDCKELQMYNGSKWVEIKLGTATQPNNQSPVASDVIISGSLEVGQTLTGSYTYSDYENNPEGISLYQWYRADDASGTNQVTISGATDTTYVLDMADETKYLSFEVTPVTNTGISPGMAVMGSYQGAIAPWACGSTLNDARDSKTYATVQIGTQCWMAENLNIGTRTDGMNNQTNNNTLQKYCYADNKDFCDTYGGLYQWDEMMQYSTTPGVQGICPGGWHIPSDAEWMILEEEVESSSGVDWNTTGFRGTDVGGNLKDTTFIHWWAPNTGATNSSGFTGLPGGVRNYHTYWMDGVEGTFWSSNEAATSAWLRQMKYTEPALHRHVAEKVEGLSVRCLRD